MSHSQLGIVQNFSVVEVSRPGGVTVQDAGRPGYAHLGVPHSGALDRAALNHANALVANAHRGAGAAALELLLSGCTIEAHTPLMVALTGAVADAFVGSVPAPRDAPLRLAPGQRLEIEPPRTGAAAYLAVAGGIGATPVLGSRSTDVLSGTGPAPVVVGDSFALAAEPSDVAFGRREGPSLPGATVTIPVDPGPRADWFAPEAIDLLTSGTYEVTADSNRVGLRLNGAALPRTRDEELPSEGLVTGAIQVPASGQPVVFLADHPTTGGYPVIAVVDPATLRLLGQSRPGTRIVFAVRD